METMVDGKDFSQKHIDKAKKDNKHVLVAIGFLGGMQCYLDMDYNECVKRFAAEFHGPKEQADHTEYGVTIIGFDDSFGAYEVREND